MNYKKLILALIITTLACSVSLADNSERIQRTYKIFSSSLDELLLDTPHVYIRIGHESDGFFLTGFGPVFTADISITASASLPKAVEQWSNWFQGENSKVFINTNKKDGKTEIEINTNVDKSEKKKEEKTKEECESDMKQADLARIEKMENSIEAFKTEVMEVLLDVGPIIQGVKSREKIAIVFHVSDEEFFELYKTRTLQVQIPMGTLLEAAGSSVLESTRKFKWNI